MEQAKTTEECTNKTVREDDGEPRYNHPQNAQASEGTQQRIRAAVGKYHSVVCSDEWRRLSLLIRLGYEGVQEVVFKDEDFYKCLILNVAPGVTFFLGLLKEDDWIDLEDYKGLDAVVYLDPCNPEHLKSFAKDLPNLVHRLIRPKDVLETALAIGCSKLDLMSSVDSLELRGLISILEG